MPLITTDRARTEKRLQELEGYMTAHVLGEDKTMRCPYFEECKRSVREGDRFGEGQLLHVGHHYDLTVDGTAMRIVVVGQEPGLWALNLGAPPRHAVTLQECYHLVHDHSGLTARYYAGPGRRGRNPHMRGTTSALRILFGKGLGTDHDD